MCHNWFQSSIGTLSFLYICLLTEFTSNRFEGIDKIHDLVRFSSKKLLDLGFEYKYSLEDMYKGAIHTCRAKGLIPLATKD